MSLKKHSECLVLALLVMAGCGPQALQNPNSLTLQQPTTPANECSPGVTGIDSDSDGINDDCQNKLQLPIGDADCDHDGIPNSTDNPKDCVAGSDPNTCDQYCEEFRRRQLAELADSFALGGAAIGGQAFPGVNVVIKQKVFVFANSTGSLNIGQAVAQIGGASNKLINTLCNGTVQTANGPQTVQSNFYIYTSGDVSYSEFIVGGETIPQMDKKNINFEMCGLIYDGDSGSTVLDPAKLAALSARPGSLKATMFAGNRGAYPIRALISPNNETRSKVTLTPTAEVTINPPPSSCSSASVSGFHLYNKMTFTLEPFQNTAMTNLVITGDTDQTKTGATLSGTFSVEKVEQKLKRTITDTCKLITAPELDFGVGGSWIKE
jgi:hypothetical protein